MAGSVTRVSFLIFALIFGAGAVSLLLGIGVPSRLSALNRLWSRIGATIAKVVNPIVSALLHVFLVFPMALVMRIAGK